MITVTNLTPKNIKNYLNNIQNQYSASSYNRKLSSLRQFIAFLEEKRRIDKEKARELQRVLNPKNTQIGTNRSDTIHGIKNSDAVNRITTNSNRINFTSHFTLPVLAFLLLSINIFFLGKIKSQILNGISQDSVLGQTEKSSSKNLKAVKLPLSAILTDNYNIPLSYEQDISFSIYPSENSPNPIYSTGRCTVLPDNNGKVKITIGQDCGRPVPYNIFQENLELYLGVSLGFGSELLPRTPIKRLNIVLQRPTAAPTPSPTVFFIEKSQESTPSNTID
jgi:hypothetical protein